MTDIEKEYHEHRMGQFGLVRKLWARCQLDWIEAKTADVLGPVEGKPCVMEYQCPHCEDTHESIEIWSRQ
jgi:hypothetical protein